jgi:hypothetical protein
MLLEKCWGKHVYSDGAVYEGDWKNDKKEGQGKCVYSNGDVYEVDWKNNFRDGYGKLIEKNGTVKEGRFDCGEFVG